VLVFTVRTRTSYFVLILGDVFSFFREGWFEGMEVLEHGCNGERDGDGLGGCLMAGVLMG
jgi:hypothetical protein